MANSIVKNKNSIIPTDKQKFSVFVSSEGMKAKINQMLGGRDGTAFIASIVSAVSANPELAECDNATILSAALLGESLKLSPSATLGQYYIIPYNDNKYGRKVAQFQLGYKGYVQLAIRSGQYKRLNVMAIKEGELIHYDALEESIEVNLIDDEEKREKAPTIGYYAMFEYNNGFRKTLYWSKAKMERHAIRYSKGYAAKKGYTFWEKDFDGMALKTMLRQLISKWGVMSVETQKGFDADMAVIKDNGTYDYVDNVIPADDSGSLDIKPETVTPAEPEPAAANPADEKPEYTAGGKPITAEPADGNDILFS